MDTLMIGISGMRGTIGGTLRPDVITRMSAAFAVWLNRQPQISGRPAKVVIGRDSRPSGTFVRDLVVGTLTASGVSVIDLDVVTTPGVAMMVRHLQADAGVIVTASHNPIQWNGLKFLTRDCVAPPSAEAAAIRKLYDDSAADYVRIDRVVQVSRNSQTHALHVHRVLQAVDSLSISTKRFKVVLDSVNGAGCVATATLLSKLGCQVVHLNGTPDGQFPHEPEPTEANLTQLAAEVRRQHAAVGFAQDPDADRLAVVDENGTYIGEEYSLALAALHVLGKRPGVTVANLSTSRMLDDVAAMTGSRVIRTPVGEANVIDTMIREQAIIGGEGNGGVIDPRIVPGRDSLVGMAYILQLMAEANTPLSRIVERIPRYQIVKTKFECRREDAERAVEAIAAAFSDNAVDRQDGIRIDFAVERAWVHARPSNTEPIMRIIAEAPDRATADAKVAAIRKVVDRAMAGAEHP